MSGERSRPTAADADVRSAWVSAGAKLNHEKAMKISVQLSPYGQQMLQAGA